MKLFSVTAKPTIYPTDFIILNPVGLTRKLDRQLSRLTSLDAIRGFFLLMMIPSPVLPAIEKHPQAAWLLSQFIHSEWVGVTFWDLFQPAFLFMAGFSICLFLR